MTRIVLKNKKIKFGEKEIMEKENVIEKEIAEKEITEFNEDKVRLVFDYSAILRKVGYLVNNGKNYVNYSFVISVDGMRDFKVKLDENLYNYIILCEKLGVQPFVSKQIVREFSEEKNKEYTCLKVVTRKGSIFRSFIDRSTIESLDMVYEIYQAKNKK